MKKSNKNISEIKSGNHNFEEGKRIISVRALELGENLLSDRGQRISDSPVKRGIDDLVKLKIIEKRIGKPGQINEFIIKLPSEIREVQEMIKKDEEEIEEIIDDSKDDFYTDPQKRVEILKREDYKCFYCIRELERTDFYLDHLVPRTQGGQNYKSNLVASCRACNTNKNALGAENFLLQNYRKGLLTQEEYQTQKDRLTELRREYGRVEHSVNSDNTT